jgi:hypothetical protein
MSDSHSGRGWGTLGPNLGQGLAALLTDFIMVFLSSSRRKFRRISLSVPSLPTERHNILSFYIRISFIYVFTYLFIYRVSQKDVYTKGKNSVL